MKESLRFIQKQEFKKSSIKDPFEIQLNRRGYNVNDKVNLIIDSKIQTIGFFSGAGSLGIDSQLAGAKIISSIDFAKDSVVTMMTNKYFTHTIHFRKRSKK